MKSSFVRPAIALALALGLSACGGKATFTVGGVANNLIYSGLKLSTNGQTISVEPTTVGTPANVEFTFPKSLDYGEVYNITIASLPAHQSCVPYAAFTDTAGRLATIHATINCSLIANALTGKINGLKANGLKLANGSDTLTLDGASTTNADGTTTTTFPSQFTFAGAVVYGTTYGITILSQPTGQTCAVSPSGVGTMGDTAPTDIEVTCQ
jgi:hypothetical protein